MDISVEVYKDGRVTIPIQMRRALGIEVGDRITFRQQEGEIKILTIDQELINARQALRSHSNEEDFSVDDFLASRRKEAQQEEEEINAMLKNGSSR
ncbi:MAG: AbrB/MazE/SpoVT family DNA-binding domain-containing protein [Cyanobacteria bacterium J06649_11]